MIVERIKFNEDLYSIGFRSNSDMTIKINELISNMIRNIIYLITIPLR